VTDLEYTPILTPPTHDTPEAVALALSKTGHDIAQTAGLNVPHDFGLKQEDALAALGWKLVPRVATADWTESTLALSESHKPGDPHQYRTECHICGERGYLHLSLEPQFAVAPRETSE
jgi:hypothetical protein